MYAAILGDDIVAVKAQRVQDADDTARIVTEATLLEHTPHPCVTSIIDCFIGNDDPVRGYLCIVMPLYNSGDLATKIQAKCEARTGCFDTTVVLSFIAQIALALEFLHHAKIIHRDVKPKNVFLHGGNQLVLGDLGIARVLDVGASEASTVAGTRPFMAPEVLKNERYSYAVDMWALGVLLYQLANAGSNPLSSAQDLPFNSIAEVLHSPPKPLPSSSSRGSSGDGLQSLYESMLEKEGGRRVSARGVVQSPQLREIFAGHLTHMYAAAEGKRRSNLREQLERLDMMVFVE